MELQKSFDNDAKHNNRAFVILGLMMIENNY